METMEEVRRFGVGRVDWVVRGVGVEWVSSL